jgi:hypothetical protein
MLGVLLTAAIALPPCPIPRPKEPICTITSHPEQTYTPPNRGAPRRTQGSGTRHR